MTKWNPKIQEAAKEMDRPGANPEQSLNRLINALAADFAQIMGWPKERPRKRKIKGEGKTLKNRK